MGDSRSSKAGAVAAVVTFIAVALSADVTVSSITPASGLTRGGEIVHIHGTNLLGPPLLCPSITCSTYLKFGDVLGTILDVAPAEIVVVAPPHAAGRVDVQVNVPTNAPVTLPSAYNYEDPAGDVRLLVPVVINTAGAGGTSWQSELTVHNENAEALPFAGTTIAPFASAVVTLPPSNGSAGAFVTVPRRLADNVSANVRVHDATRDADSWGAEVPVVPETQFRRSVILPGVPADARYRTLLRVYGYGASDTTVTIAFRDDATGELLGSRTLAMQAGYAQLPIDATRPRIRVQVTAESSLIWAFVSITNNTTQQVTTITPTFTANAVALPAALTNGHWGANGNCVDVSNAGVSVSASDGCAFGGFPKPTVGADGHFEADGTLFSGGVSPPPGPPPSAHFSGVVQGTSMTLTARSGARTFGPWTVQFGNLSPCGPFCP
jgi:IPT/TIG domain